MTIRLLSVVLLIAGCAARQDFVPLAPVTASSPDGKAAAAEYVASGTKGGDLGDVRLWTDGAYVAEVDGRRSTVVPIGFDVANDQDEPLTLSEVWLEGVRLRGRSVRSVSPIRVEGPTTVAPGERARARAYFALPTDRPYRVERFDVHWTVRRGEAIYEQRTPFVRGAPGHFEQYGYYAGDEGYYHPEVEYGRPFYFFPNTIR